MSEPVGRLGLTVAALVSALLAGCAPGAADDLPPPPDPSRAPAVPADPAHQEILAAYEGYIRASNEAANLGDPDHPELREYADAGALAEARAAIRQHAENGRVYSGGRVVVSAEVTRYDPDAPFPEPGAAVTACLDISDYLLVQAEDASPLPVERELEQVMAAALLWYTPDGRWMVIDADADWDTPC